MSKQTDITRLLISIKRRSAHAKEFGHDVLFVKIEDLDALVEALEAAEAKSDGLWYGEIRVIRGRQRVCWRVDRGELFE